MNEIKPEKIALHLCMVAFTGTAKHLRETHGVEPVTGGGAELYRQHLAEHGVEITDGRIGWPVRQEPRLSDLLPRDRAEKTAAERRLGQRNLAFHIRENVR